MLAEAWAVLYYFANFSGFRGWGTLPCFPRLRYLAKSTSISSKTGIGLKVIYDY